MTSQPKSKKMFAVLPVLKKTVKTTSNLKHDVIPST